MDLTLNYSEDDSPLSLKSDFILSLMELIVGGKAGLEPVEKTIIDRCVHMVYREYLQDPRPEKMPILGDLHALLCQQTEPEAQRLATALEIYVSGSLNVFNHRTNVEINSRIVCYVIKKLGKQLKKLGMQIVQDQIWGRVSENREARKSTRLYIDEMHLLLKEEQTAAYTVEIWKRFRKWGGIPTGITQNVKDLLSSREIQNIFENSDFIYMLNQASGDRQILAKQLNISPYQLSYVTNSGPGEGVLSCNGEKKRPNTLRRRLICDKRASADGKAVKSSDFKKKAECFGTIKGGMHRSETRRCPRPCSAQGRDAEPTVKGIRAWTAREHNFRNCWLSRPCPSDAGRGECRGVMTARNFCGRRADDADARESWRYGKPKANSRRGLKFQTLRNAVICL